MSGGAESLEVEMMDRSAIAVDDPVTLELGYDGSTQTVFTGSVAVVEPGLEGVRLIALGKMDALMRLRMAAFYEGRTAGDIVKDLAGQAGLDTDTIDDGPELPRYAVDRRLSGYTHCRELAARLGFELYTSKQGKLMFRALGAAASLDAGGLGGALGAAASVLGLSGGEGYEAGKHLLAATARRAKTAADRIEVAGESPMSSEGDSAAHWLTPETDNFRGEAGSGNSSWLVVDLAARTQDLAGRFAQGYLVTAQRPANAASIAVFGRESLELGDSIRVSSAADPLINSSWYIQALRHELSRERGFRTEMRLIPESAS
jgi:phage protein D